MKQKNYYKSIPLSAMLLLGFWSSNAQVQVDLGSSVDYPLVKTKLGQYEAIYSSTNTTIQNNLSKIAEVEAPTYRMDIGIGKGDHLGGNPQVVGGTAANPTFNFSVLDGLFNKLNQLNVLPLASWCYIPTPLNTGNHRELNPIANWQTYWQNFYKNYSKHYKDAGIRIGYHEVSNEPDIPEFMTKATWDNYYQDMYRYGALGLKEGNPDAVVGGPALAWVGNASNFLNFTSSNNLPMDFFSFHAYDAGGGSWNDMMGYARGALNAHSEYKTTDMFIDEFTWYALNTSDAETAPVNSWSAAPKTMETFNLLLNTPDITMVSWAMFQNAYTNGIGLLDWTNGGKKKSAFNAFKVYADMPVNRKKITLNNANIKGFASCSNHKISVCIWNNNAVNAQTVTVDLASAPFASGNFRYYRIDQTHANYQSGTEDLVAEGVASGKSTTGSIWTGSIPASGLIYIVMDDGQASPDFTPSSNYSPLMSTVKDIKTWHYYPSRPLVNYADFDRKTWQAYLGSGSSGSAYSITGIEAEQLPSTLDFSFNISGTPANLNVNSLLGVRIDYKVGSSYTKSVLLHGGIYNAGRNEVMPWGTKAQATQVVQVNSLSSFSVTLADYAPANWSGRAIISYVMESTGANTRAIVSMNQTVPLGNPSSLSYSGVTASKVDLAWQDNASAETGFKIERKLSTDANYTQIATVGANVTTYTDNTVSPSSAYMYRVFAYDANSNSGYSNVATATTKGLTDGDGLAASYWTAKGVVNQWPQTVPPTWFIDSICGDIDPVLNHTWADDPILGRPSCLGSNNTDGNFWSARWRGYIKPRYTEAYTFCVSYDDGVDLWVNGTKIINTFPWDGKNSACGTINLEAGKLYPIRIDLAEYWGAAFLKLEWNSTSQAKEVVPTSQLFSTNVSTGVASLTEQAFDVSIYPNPVIDGHFTLVLPDNLSQEKVQVEVRDMQGRIVLQEQLVGLVQYELATKGMLESGIYLVTVKTDQMSTFKKIVVQ